LSFGLSAWALIPEIGFSIYAPLALIISTFNLLWFKIKNRKNHTALIISLILTVSLIWSFL
jgi:hypothetical protein